MVFADTLMGVIDLTCMAWIMSDVVSRPWWLALAALALVPPVLAHLARRRGRNMPRLSVVAQCAALVAVAGALAGVGLPLGAKAFKPCLLLRDVSGSVRGQSDIRLPWPGGLDRKTYGFAAGVATRRDEVDPVGTHAKAALGAAAAEARDVSGIVIHTDGQFTDDWRAAAEALGEEAEQSGADVMIVPMESPPPEVRIVGVSARRGVGSEVGVTVSLVANMSKKRKLTVWRGGAKDDPLLSREWSMVGAETVRLTDTLDESEQGQYHVELSPPDVFPENDSASALVLPRALRVAVVGREAGRKRALKMLDGMGAAVDWLLLRNVPATQAGWSRYAAVVLVDATGTLLAAAQREALAAYVRNGGGLVLIGACPHRTAADRTDPLTKVAALVANPYQRRPMKVTVILDASGSMTGSTRTAHGTRQVRFAVAADAVMALKRHLTSKDALAVITFSDRPRDIYDSGGRQIDFLALRDALSKVRPGGPTRVGDALARAAARPPAEGRTELVIVVSDLETESFDAGAVKKRMDANGKALAIVATVPVGTSKSDLTKLALMPDVALKHSENLSGLAEVFAGFLSDHRGSAVRRDGPFLVQVVGNLFGADVKSLGKLPTYVLSAPQHRPAATVLLRVGAERHALLGSRFVGLGRSVTLSADLAGDENASWQASAQVARLVRAAAEWSLRRSPDPRYAGSVVEEGGKWVFRFHARDPEAGPINLLDLKLRVERADDPAADDASDVPLLQVAPGRYEAELPRPAHAVLLAVRQAGKGQLWLQAQGRSVAPEFRAIGANRSNLRRLAELTGGEVVSSWNVGGITGRWDRRQYTDIWPVLAGLALLLVLVDWVATRTWKRWR